MRACVQRASQGRVTVDGQVVGQIGPGLVVLVGVAAGDTPRDVAWMAEKVAGLRIFEDDAGKMNRSVIDTAGRLLLISQFTLLGDCQKGKRPSFTAAAPPELAERLYTDLVEALRGRGLGVETGRFRAHMEVLIVNDGPVTILLDSRPPGAAEEALPGE